MFHRVLYLLLIVSVMCCSPAASARSGHTAASAVDAMRDARLAARLRLRAEAIPLRQVLRALADETGVRLNVAGAAGHERLVAFVPDAPLAEVMLAIADLYRLSWIRSGSAERPSYQLLKLPALAREEQALRDQSVGQLLARLGEKLRAPPPPARGRPDPWASVYPHVMPLLMARSGDLGRDGHVYLPIAAVPVEQRRPLVRVLQPVMDARHAELRELARASRERRQAEGGPDFVSSAETSPAPTAESSTLTMELAVRDELTASVGLKTSVGIQYGWLMASSEGLQAAGMDLYKDRRPTLPAEADEGPERTDEAGTDPLARRVEVRAEKSPRPGDWIGALGRLSDASGVALYADCYTNFLEGINGHPRSDFAVSGEVSVERVLNRLCFPLANRGAKKLAVSSFWWRRGDAALIRSRRWLWESAAVLPTDLLDRLTASLRATRQINPNDLPAIANLTGLQVQSVGFLDGGWDVWHRAIQVPARLSLESRKRLMADGLTWEKMPPGDRVLLERLLPHPAGGSLSRYAARLKTSVGSNPAQGGTVASMEIEAMGETQMEAVFLHLPLPGAGAAPGLPPQRLEVGVRKPSATQLPDRRSEETIRMETLTYKKVGNLQLRMDVYRAGGEPTPSVAGLPVPVVVWIHGGALINGNRTGIDARAKKRALDAGYAFVSIDHRLAPETKLPAIVEDLEDAFTWLRANGRKLLSIDTSRIAVMGASAGGYLTLTSGFRVNPRPTVLVAFWGYGDLIGDWYSQPSHHARHHQSRMTEAEARRLASGPPVADSRDRNGDGGAFYQHCRQHGLWPKEVSGWDPYQESEKFTPFMPLRNVTPDYPPTMLVHGTNDTDVPYEQSVMMADALRKQNVECELVTIPGAEHGLSGGDEALIEAAYDSALAFVTRHMKR